MSRCDVVGLRRAADSSVHHRHRHQLRTVITVNSSPTSTSTLCRHLRELYSHTTSTLHHTTSTLHQHDVNSTPTRRQLYSHTTSTLLPHDVNSMKLKSDAIMHNEHNTFITMFILNIFSLTTGRCAAEIFGRRPPGSGLQHQKEVRRWHPENFLNNVHAIWCITLHLLYKIIIFFPFLFSFLLLFLFSFLVFFSGAPTGCATVTRFRNKA